MVKVIGMLVALAMFCAMPAVSFAGSSNDNVSSGNTQDAGIDQGAAGGDGDGDGSGSDGDDDGADGDGEDGGGEGGDAGNQAAICQQNAGDDANCDIDQSQSFDGDTFVDDNDNGVDDDNEGNVDDDNDNDNDGVEGVELARTGFDVGLLALFGGVALASGLALLIVQRRRTS